VGPTVLLLHGWSGAAAQWSRFIDPLVRAGFNAVALDLPPAVLDDITWHNAFRYLGIDPPA